MKERTATKSMLASKNTRPAITTPQQGMHWLGVLGGELNVRLRDAREINPGLWPKTMVLGTRTGMSFFSSSFSSSSSCFLHPPPLTICFQKSFRQCVPCGS